MSIYSIALFIHIVAAVGLFVTLALEWTGQRQLQRAITLEQARMWLPVVAGSRRIGIPSMIIVILSGFSMARAAWRHLAWTEVTVGTLVAIIALGAIITRPRLAAIARALAAESAGAASLLRDPMLTLSLQTRAAMTLGIVFLMTVKPDLRVSLLAIAAAAMLGIISAVPLLRMQQAGGRS